MNKTQDSRLVIYQDANGEIRVDVQVRNETVWLSLKQISEVFDRDKSVISKHLTNIFKEGELDKDSTVAKFATVQIEGERKIARDIEFYNLDAILSVGYRVNSKKGVQFRKWASNVLKDHLIEGYSINRRQVTEHKLKQLRQTVELLSDALINQNLVTDTGRELLELIKSYNKTWDMLIKYDEDSFGITQSLGLEAGVLLDYKEAITVISVLKTELKQESGSLFGLERGAALQGILGAIDQTFGGKDLHDSVEEKAAHLLYCVIKSHPFCDGNKRIGSLLFLLYLNKAKIGLKNMSVSAITSLALLIAESSPTQKDLMIKLIVNLISE